MYSQFPSHLSFRHIKYLHNEIRELNFFLNSNTFRLQSEKVSVNKTNISKLKVVNLHFRHISFIPT